MFCPANWRQQPDELAFVIDDLAPAVVVWQEEEVGPSVRAGRARAGARRPLDPPRHRGSRARRVRGVRRRRQRRPTPTRTRPRDAPLLLVYTAAFDGRPNAAMLPSRALIAQGLLMAPWSGIDADVRVPQLRAAVPHRDVHAEPVDVRHGRHERVRPALRRRRPVPCDRGARRHRRLRHRADGRRDRRRERRRPVTTCRRSAASAATPSSTRGCSPTRRRGAGAPVATDSPR